MLFTNNKSFITTAYYKPKVIANIFTKIKEIYKKGFCTIMILLNEKYLQKFV